MSVGEEEESASDEKRIDENGKTVVILPGRSGKKSKDLNPAG